MCNGLNELAQTAASRRRGAEMVCSSHRPATWFLLDVRVCGFTDKALRGIVQSVGFRYALMRGQVSRWIGRSGRMVPLRGLARLSTLTSTSHRRLFYILVGACIPRLLLVGTRVARPIFRVFFLVFWSRPRNLFFLYPKWYLIGFCKTRVLPQ